MEVTVRRIRPGEGEVLSRLRLGALADAPGAFASTYEAEVGRSASDWQQRAVAAASGDDLATFVAVTADGPAGLVTSYRESGRSFELIAMWVAPAARLGGVGSRLVEAALEWAASAGAATVNLWVMEDNPRAIALYRGARFTVVQACDGELRMTLAVGPPPGT